MSPTTGSAPASLGLRKLVSNIGQTLGRQSVGILFGLGTSVVIARMLGPTGNGLYAVAMLLPTFLATFLNLGISQANVYYVGSHSVAPRTAIKASTHIWLILAIMGTGIGAISIVFFGETLFPGVPSLLLWIALLGFPLSLLQGYLSSLLQALQDFGRYNTAIIASPVLMFVLVSLFLLSGGGVASIVVASVMVQLLNLAITVFLVRHLFAAKPDSTSDNYEISVSEYPKHAIQYGYKAHLSNILAFVNYKVDIFLVNLLINPAAAGIYVIAVSMSEKLWLLSQAIGTVTLPRLSELRTQEETRRQLTPFLARWTLITTGGAAVLFAVITPFAIRILYGQAYLQAINPLLLLLPGIVLGSLSRVLANDVAARGRPELNMYTAAIVVIVNVVGNMLLIPSMGLAGAALATTVAYSVNCFFRIWVYSRLSQNSWYSIFTFNSHDARVLNQLYGLVFKMLTGKPNTI